MAAAPISRWPEVESLRPPKGAWSSRPAVGLLMWMTPDSRRRANSRERWRFLVERPAERPNSTELAILMASSKSFAFITERTGPKVSYLARRLRGVAEARGAG